MAYIRWIIKLVVNLQGGMLDFCDFCVVHVEPLLFVVSGTCALKNVHGQ